MHSERKVSPSSAFCWWKTTRQAQESRAGGTDKIGRRGSELPGVVEEALEKLTPIRFEGGAHMIARCPSSMATPRPAASPMETENQRPRAPPINRY